MNMENRGGKPFVKELYGAAIKRTYMLDSNTGKVAVTSSETARWTSVANFFTSVFLPHGYPESVSKDYLQYQFWDSIQAFASSITGSICTHSLLKGSGVGDASASTIAATLTWIMRDGTSMIGRIVFSWLQGTKLDSDCKKWRLFADVLNDFAMFLELMSACFKEYFLIIVCASGVLKSVVGVAGGATRASLTQHQARKNNMADVSAKDGSQETLVNLTALICSLIIIPNVVGSQVMIWLTYLFMTFVHLLANYFAVKSVSMETFNMERFQIYMNNYVNSSMQSFLSVAEVNKRESVFLMPSGQAVSVKLGVSFSEAIARKSWRKINELMTLYEKCDYFLTFSKESDEKGKVSVCFRRAPSSPTLLEAMYQACLICHMFSSNSNRQSKSFLWNMYSMENTADESFEYEQPLEIFTRKVTKEYFQNFKQRTEMCGWRIDATLFNVDLWQVMW